MAGFSKLKHELGLTRTELVSLLSPFSHKNCSVFGTQGTEPKVFVLFNILLLQTLLCGQGFFYKCSLGGEIAFKGRENLKTSSWPLKFVSVWGGGI